MTQIVVPFIDAAEGDGREEAVIIGRALARAGFGNLRWATRGRRQWDPRLSVLLGQFEHKMGLKASPTPTRRYTRATHAKLARFYDRNNLARATALTAVSEEDKLRARVVGELMYFYNHRYGTPYKQWRPYSRKKPASYSDCSGSKAWADERAGAPRTGMPWGYGNTYTQIAHYRRIGRVIVTGRNWSKKVKVGDPVYYGGPSHVTVIVSIKGTVVKVFSFGAYPAKILDLDYRSDRHWICSLLGED
jgi:hypothetical protein